MEAPLAFKQPNIRPQIEMVQKLATGLTEKLRQHAERFAEFKAHLPQAQSLIDDFAKANFEDVDQIQMTRTFATGLTSVPGQDSAIQEDIAAAVREIEKTHASLRQSLQNDPQTAFDGIIGHSPYSEYG
jgi:DNA anti-recombination protein RmuC